MTTLAACRQWLNSPPVATVVVSILVFLCVLGARELALLQPLELVAYDWQVRWRPTRPAPPRVTAVTITEEDIQRLGRWPLADGIVAVALDRILQYKPRAVGIDFYRDIPIPPGRQALERIIVEHPNVITGMRFPRAEEPGVPPPSVAAETGQYAFTDWVVDPGGTVRRALLILDDGQDYVFSLALRTALIYLEREAIYPAPDPETPQHLRLGNTTIPPIGSDFGGYSAVDDSGYQYLLGYREDLRSIPTLSLQALLEEAFDPNLLADRVVLIGVSAESVKDYFYTPYSGAESESPITPGVVLHAHAVSQLLRFALDGEQPMRALSEAWEAAWILLWALLGGLLGLRVRSPVFFASSGIVGLIVLLGLVYAQMGEGLWMPLVAPALTWLVSATIVTAYVSYTQMKERENLMHLFSRHVAPQLATDIWEHRDQFLSGGHPKPQRLVGSVFFSDVVAFSTISEELDPPTLMDWLNDYMALMTPIINNHDGVILRFIGDAIMVVFGAPIPRETEEEIDQDAINAVDCALAMQQALVEHNHRLAAKDMPLVATRVGIFTGSMVAGSIGDAERVEYNVHGDTVNTAARLEAYMKDDYVADFFRDPCRIFIGEPTYQRVGDRYQTEIIGEARLRGKAKPTTVYRVMGRLTSSPSTAAAPPLETEVGSL